MQYNIPNQNILKAFGVSGDPVRLEGGQGTCYRVNDVVLKPTNNTIEASWLANVFNNLVSDQFRVPRPIRANDGSWVFEVWTASEFVEGEHEDGNYKEAVEVSKIFHEALVDIPKPDFFDTRNDVWAVADRIAWGESPIPDIQLTNEPLRRIFSHLKNNELPNQLIHGDWGTGNLLFSKKLGPAIIDFSPYWRPANFAIAVMIIDALIYEGADKSIIDLYKETPEYKQFLLRALARRICEYIGHQNHPENTEDRSSDIIKHLNIIDTILES
jgi:uncharacterized protein (TIGR02569 family)